jgi:predicted alpha/beta-fold hydrolase
VLKLAGELGESAASLIAAVCAVSTPIDLGASCQQVGRRSNRLYERRFVCSMSERVRAMCRRIDGFFPVEELEQIHSLYEFDDRVTAPLSGFRDAEHYYDTQSAIKFLDRIQIPARLIQAKDDPMVPNYIYGHPSIAANSNIQLTLTEHGGHLGFLSRTRPRFWLDETVVAWISEMHERIGTRERYIGNAG